MALVYFQADGHSISWRGKKFGVQGLAWKFTAETITILVVESEPRATLLWPGKSLMKRAECINVAVGLLRFELGHTRALQHVTQRRRASSNRRGASHPSSALR